MIATTTPRTALSAPAEMMATDEPETRAGPSTVPNAPSVTMPHVGIDANTLVADMRACATSLAMLAATFETGHDLGATRTPATKALNWRCDRPPTDAREIGDRDITAQLYVAGCAGLRRLCEDIGRNYGLTRSQSCVYKIGVVARSRRLGDDLDCDLVGRLAALGADRYGGTILDDQGRTHLTQGHEAWRACALGPSRAPFDPRIKVGARTLGVCLPSSVTLARFDAALRAILEPSALFACWPAQARYTSYADLGTQRGCDLARELYVGIDPMRNADSLIAAVERALITVGGVPNRDRPRDRRKPNPVNDRRQTIAGSHLAAIAPLARRRRRPLDGDEGPAGETRRKPMSGAQRRAMAARLRMTRTSRPRQ